MAQSLESSEVEMTQAGKSRAQAFFQRYFIDAMSSMALGLFSSLIIGLILSQLSQIPGLGMLKGFADMVSAFSPVVGAAIGVAVAYGLKVKPLAIFSSAVTGALGYQLGGPVGSYLAAVLGAEAGHFIAGKTPVDIVLIPIFTIVTGGLVARFTGPAIMGAMGALGQFINEATRLQPLPMGIVVSVVMGMALTAPISSAAIAISLGLNGLAAGAACVGCCANMMGFAVLSYPDNGLGGLLSQGLGTSMLQFGNILKKPVIWLPAILTSALLGPVSTVLLKMHNNPLGAGMGTSGLVGQFGAWASRPEGADGLLLLGQIVLMHFLLPALLTWVIGLGFKKAGWIRPGDLKVGG